MFMKYSYVGIIKMTWAIFPPSLFSKRVSVKLILFPLLIFDGLLRKVICFIDLCVRFFYQNLYCTVATEY